MGAHGSAARERPSLAGSPPPGARRPESSCDPERPSCPPGVSHHSRLAEDSAGEATTVPCPLLTSHRAEVPGVGSVDSKTALGSQHLLQHTVGVAGRGGGSVFACLFFFFFFFNSSLAYHKISPWNHLPGQNSHAPGTKRVPSVGTLRPRARLIQEGMTVCPPRPVEQVRSSGETPALELMRRTESRITSEAV